MHINSFRYLGFLITVILFGCSSTLEYPKKWEPIDRQSTTDCKFISGVYLNSDETVVGRGPSKLTRVLHKQGQIVSDFHSVKIEFDQNLHLIISGITKPDATPLQLSVIRNYECKNGALEFEFSSVTSGDNVVGMGSSKRRLFKSGNYLVVETDESGVGIVLLIPVVASANYWYRFPKIDSNNK